MKRYGPLSMSNPLFATYVIAATLVILKAVSMSWLTVVRMMGVNGGLRSPEDIRKTPLNPNPDPAQLEPNERVERIRRIQLNDLENLPYFLVAGFLFLFTNPSLLVAQCLFYGYVVSRLLHFLAYLTAQTHDLRAMLWTPGSLILIYFAGRTLVASLCSGPEAHAWPACIKWPPGPSRPSRGRMEPPADRGGTQILESVEAERPQLGRDLARREAGQPRLAHRRHPRQPSGLERLLLGRIVRHRLSIVEHHLRSGGPRGDERQGLHHRGAGQVDRDAQPREERGRRQVEPGAREALRQGLSLEVHRREGQGARCRQPGRRQPLAFPSLGGGEVHLETRSPASSKGLRCAKVSSPAPSTTYWRTLRTTAAARVSSAKRLRAAMNRRIDRVAGRSSSAPNTSSGASPSTGTANASANTRPPSISWCAARCAAARNAVRLGSPGCMLAS